MFYHGFLLQHTDAVMALHGDVIMQACAVVIEMTSSPIKWTDDGGSSVQTHAMCVLNCVAAGDIQNTVKKFIIDNDNIISKLVQFLTGDDVEVSVFNKITFISRQAEEDVYNVC